MQISKPNVVINILRRRKTMRKYIIVVLIFILSACSLGQKHTSQPASAPTNAPVSVPTVAAAAPTNPLATTATPESNPTSSSSTSLLSPPPVPQNGAYLGAWVNPAKESDQVMVSGGTNVEISQLAQFQTNLGGRLPGVLNFYAEFLDPFPLTTLQDIEAKGSIPLISWGGASSCATASIPAGQYTSGIAAGQYDQQINQYANGLKAFGHPVFVRWFWEMNISKNNDPCNGSAGASGYVAAWRHIYTFFHQAGATNVAFVWCPRLPVLQAWINISLAQTTLTGLGLMAI